jgi:hypothetical protein
MVTYLSLNDYTRLGIFDKVVKISRDNRPKFYPLFTQNETTKNMEFVVGSKVGPGVAPVVVDGDNYTSVSTQTPFRRSYTVLVRGYNFPLTTLAMESDPYGVLRDRAKDMVDGITLAMEYDAAEFINLNRSTIIGIDGVSLGNSAHPLGPGGGTYSNISATEAALGYGSLAAAQTNIFSAEDYNGDPSAITGPFKLCVAPSLQFIAKELVYSPDRPDVADRAKNVVANPQTVEVVVNPFFSSTTGWALIKSGAENPLKMVTRRSLRTAMLNQEAVNDSHVYSVNCVWTKAPYEWRGTFFSTGLGA